MQILFRLKLSTFQAVLSSNINNQFQLQRKVKSFNLCIQHLIPPSGSSRTGLLKWFERVNETSRLKIQIRVWSCGNQREGEEGVYLRVGCEKGRRRSLKVEVAWAPATVKWGVWRTAASSKMFSLVWKWRVRFLCKRYYPFIRCGLACDNHATRKAIA